MGSDRLCIDIDNTIAQTDFVMRAIIKKVTGGRVDLQYEQVLEFAYQKCDDGRGSRLTNSEWEHVHNLFSQRESLLTVMPFDGAPAYLTKLAAKYELHIATTRLPQARRTTIEWLEIHGFPSHSLHFLRHGQKHIAVGAMAGVVEDHYEQALDFALAGTPAYLLRRPWNAFKPAGTNITWVDNWEQLVQILV